MPPELVESAQEQQQDFTEDDLSRRGLVEDYLEVLLPTSWAGMSAEKRRGWFQEDDSIREAGTVRRDYISAVEVWAECFGNDPHRFPARTALRSTPFCGNPGLEGRTKAPAVWPIRPDALPSCLFDD